MPVDEQSARAIDTFPKSMWSRTEFTADCWNWHGAKTSTGYGSVSHEGRTRSTHRLAYELLIGPIPENLQIDHLCGNKLCCNPRHLEPVTLEENMRRRYASASSGAALATVPVAQSLLSLLNMCPQSDSNGRPAD